MLTDMPTANGSILESLPHRIKCLRIDLAPKALKHKDFILSGVKQKSVDYILCCIVATLRVKGGTPMSFHVLASPHPLPASATALW